MTLLLASALAIAGLAVMYHRPSHPGVVCGDSVGATRALLGLLADRLIDYYEVHGDWPEAPPWQEWGEDLGALDEDGILVDLWGRPIIYLPPDAADGPGFRSVGQNGRHEDGKGDDITFHVDDLLYPWRHRQ